MSSWSLLPVALSLVLSPSAALAGGPKNGPPVGACCLPDASCVELNEQQCLANGGSFQGEMTECGGDVSYTAESCDTPFQDITVSGMSLSLGDDDGELIAIGFPFTFWGDVHEEIGVGSNGYLTFGADLVDFSNDPIPSPSDPNDLIAGLWDDLDPSAAGTVHHQTSGGPGSRQLIVQWTGVPQWSSDDANTFQVVLTEDTDCIELRYGIFSTEAFPGDYTVGVENQDGTDGVGVAAATITPGDCIRICPVVSGGCPACPADATGDQVIDGEDLLQVIDDWGCTDPPGPCPGDLNGDGVVNIYDLIAVIVAWGSCG